MKHRTNKIRRPANNANAANVSSRGRPRAFDRAEGLAKAMRVFRSLGYEAASMADLRKAIGVKQASLYAAYGSKEELFREAVALYRETDGITTSRALAANLPVREAVHTLLQDAVEAFTKAGGSSGCLVVLGAINCSTENKGVQDYLSKLRRQTVKAIKERLRQGQQDGELSESAPIGGLAAFYATVLHGLSIQTRDGMSRKRLIQVVECAMAAWDRLGGG